MQKRVLDEIVDKDVSRGKCEKLFRTGGMFLLVCVRVLCEQNLRQIQASSTGVVSWSKTWIADCTLCGIELLGTVCWTLYCRPVGVW